MSSQRAGGTLCLPELDTHGKGIEVLPQWASSSSTPATEGLGLGSTMESKVNGVLPSLKCDLKVNFL
jgi:hypothetical protein